MRRVSILLLVCLASLSGAQAVKLKFLIAGNPVGSLSYESFADGRFESSTSLAVGGMTIESKLSGTFKEGRVASFKLEQSADGNTSVVEGADGKATITAGANKLERTWTSPTAYFSNYHPILSATFLAPARAAAPQDASVDVLILDGAVNMKVNASLLAPRKITRGGVDEVVEGVKLRFGSVDIDVHVNPKGQVVAWNVPAQMTQVVAEGYESLLVDPTTLYPEISQPTMAVTKDAAVSIAMRDGVKLKADVVRPEGDGKFPAILVRTPYGRALGALEGVWWAKRGYVMVSQDVRGRGESEGVWTPFFNERKDGYDTIDWISKQPWSDGNVGMIGGSYVGWVQWWAAVEAHPALKCIIPQVSPPDPFYNVPFDHGVPFLYGSIWWARVVMDKDANLNVNAPLPSFDGFFKLPLTEVDDAVLGRNVPFVDDWWKRETASAFAGANFEADLAKVDIPALHISGWWDGDGIGTKRNYAAMARMKKPNQHLIYGPWSHAFNSSSKVGDVDYGADSVLELNSIYVRWFDKWLKGKDVWTDQPKVKAFVTGANEWRELDGWPDSRSTETALYLSSSGPANGNSGVGKLSSSPPREEEPDRYTYNPAGVKISPKLKDPDPTKTTTAVEASEIGDDTLVYKTDPLESDLELFGPVSLDLHFATSAVDTDFFFAVVDIDPLGVMRLIGLPGKIRAKYISGFDSPKLLEPGKPYMATLEHWDTAHRFKKGHRLAILLNSESFPMYARNLNTGEPVATGTRMVAAHQTIYHDAKRPSVLRFRTMPR